MVRSAKRVSNHEANTSHPSRWPRRGLLRMRLLLKSPAAVDDVGDARGKRAFVACQIEREQSDLFGGAEPSHRLPRHKELAPAGAGCGGAAEHRGSLYGAGTNAVTADALG